MNNQNKDFIYYQYNVDEKEHPDTSQSMREMGAMWSISKLAYYLDDERYVDLAEKGFAYFENNFEKDKENDFLYINITPEKIKLGYNAFAILTLLEIDHPLKEEYLEKLANGIIYMQDDNGEFRTFFYSDRGTGKDYYPGEALLALMSFYEYTEDQKYLNAVNRAFPYYVDYFRDNPNTAFIPWQSRAYYKLYKITGDREIADFIFEMNDFMLQEYLPKGECRDFDFSPGIVAAVHSEGVNMAFDLARELGEKERQQCYANFSKEVADYILTLQITDEYKYEKEAIGGFLGSENSNSMRVDRNQHAVLTLMDAIDFGIL